MDYTNKPFYVTYAYSYEEELEEVCNLLDSLNIPYKASTKDSIANSSGIIFIIPDFSWKSAIDDLIISIKEDLCEAIDKKIPLYIAYKRKSDNMLGIYEAKIESDDYITLTGIAGTGVFKGGRRTLKYLSETPTIEKINNLRLNNRKQLLLLL